MNNTQTSRNLSGTERLLFALDESPFDAIWRIAVGLAVFPFTDFLFKKKDSMVSSIEGLLIVLFLTRLLPLFIRKIIPFSASIKQAWFKRRNTGKNFDSFQWKKLLWIGAGMLFYVAFSGSWEIGRVLPVVVCVIAGAIGMYRWRLIAPTALSQT
jgi:hypothetical protein